MRAPVLSRSGGGGAGTYQTASSDLTDLVARWVAASAAGPASLDFAEDSDNGSNRARVQAPAALAADADITLPANTGTLLHTGDLADVGTPAADDKVLVRDTSDSDKVKYALASAIGGGGADVQVFTASGTWNKPAGKTFTRMFIWGAGGGGGSGRKGAAGTVRCAGGGGGSAGYTLVEHRAADLPSSLAVTVGAAGSGGAAQATNSTDGNAGTAGGSSYIGTSATDNYGLATGGGGGAGGTATSGSNGSTGSGLYTGGNGGNAHTSGLSGSSPNQNTFTVGGAGGGGVSSANAAGNGGIYRAPTVAGGSAVNGTGGTGDTGTAGTSATRVGWGGAGGGGSTVGSAGAGGAGFIGGAGGGGGAAVNDVGNSGAGGAGGAGLVVIISW